MIPLLPARTPLHISELINTVQCMDALELLKPLPNASVSSVISDPPYGAKIASWDNDIPPQEILTECLRVSSGAVVWFGAATPRLMDGFFDYDPIPDRVLIWHVTFAMVQTSANGVFYRWHPIYCWRLPNQRIIPRDILECPQNGSTNWWKHPGTKPLKLMKTLVSAFGGDIVLDPFCGSGTTGVAARDLGKRFILNDNDGVSVDIAEKRLAMPYTANMFEGPLFRGDKLYQPAGGAS